MKYARTKDGIGEVVYVVEGNTRTDVDGSVTTWTEYVVKYKHKKWNVRLSEQESENAKLSDTIEELCDEFILFYKDIDSKELVNSYIPWSTYERRSDWWDKAKRNLIRTLNNPNKKALVYGAIWTKWGLKYVAKINEKWEFKLL